MSRRRLLLVALWFCSLPAFVQNQSQVGPQAPQNEPTNTTESEMTTRTTDAQIKVHLNLVLVRAVVRDGAGKEVAGLKKEDLNC